ncbi:hypothetical protein CISIN_1g0073491mg, partial [Citrus sinensis]
FPLKAVKVMHTVALRTESSLPVSITPPTQFSAHKNRIHGSNFKSLSAFINNLCLHKSLWHEIFVSLAERELSRDWCFIKVSCPYICSFQMTWRRHSLELSSY